MTHDFREIPVLKETFDYWDARRGSRRMPRRADLDPLRDIPRLLRHIQLVEVVDGGRRFRLRVIGTRIVEALGTDGTGKCLDEIFSGERLTYVERAFHEVCQAKAACFFRDNYKTSREIDLIANRLFLPLSDDDETVSQVFGAIIFEFPGGPIGGVWRGSQGGEAIA